MRQVYGADLEEREREYILFNGNVKFSESLRLPEPRVVQAAARIRLLRQTGNETGEKLQYTGWEGRGTHWQPGWWVRGTH